MTWKTYEKAVKAARWLYGQMWSAAGGPASLTVRALDLVPESEWPSPPLTIQNIKSYLGGQTLAWENVKMSALAEDFTLIQIGYFRNTDVVATRAQRNPTRQRFIAWAVDYIRQRRGIQEITQRVLLQAWNAIPAETRITLLDTPRKKPPQPEIWFITHCGVKLTMEELWKRALEVPEISPAP